MYTDFISQIKPIFITLEKPNEKLFKEFKENCLDILIEEPIGGTKYYEIGCELITNAGLFGCKKYFGILNKNYSDNKKYPFSVRTEMFINSIKVIKSFEESYYQNIKYSKNPNTYWAPGIRVFIVVILNKKLNGIEGKYVIVKKEDIEELEKYLKYKGVESIWILEDNIECVEYNPIVAEVF